jgi:sugar phosphate isomerase/epimerase
MKRRELLAAAAGLLGPLRERAAALDPDSGRNIKWAVSSFLWTSTVWPDQPPLPYTDMLDVIRDTGFDGFRMTGWPGILDRINLTLPQLEKELSKRNLRVATLSFGGQADEPARHKEIEKSAREACRFLNRFGSTELVVFGPRRVNKVLVREHLRIACEFYNRLGEVCAEYGIRAGQHNHSQGALIESQDEIELLLKWTDPKKFHWCPDTVHLYMAGCDILGLFQKHAHRLIFFDLVDARYQYAREDLHLPNGKVEKAGTHNATFMLSNVDYGDGEVDLQGIMRILKKRNYKGWINLDHHYARGGPRQAFTRCRKYIREKLTPIYA